MAFMALGAFSLAPLLGGILQNVVPGPAGNILGTIMNPLSLLTGGLGGSTQQAAAPDYSGVIQIAEIGVAGVVGAVLLYKLTSSNSNSNNYGYSGGMQGYNPMVMMSHMTH